VERPRLKRNDVLLVLLAVVVVAGAVYTVKQGSAVPQGEDILSAPATPAPTTPAPTTPASTTPASTTPDPVVDSPTPSAPFTFVAPSATATVRRRVVLLGEDLTDPAVVSKVADTLGTPVVLATGHAMTVRDFCIAAFARADLDWERHVAYDPRYERPSEVDALIGDASKAEQQLGWKAQTYGEALVNVMVDADIQAVDDHLSGRGVRIDR